MRYRQLGWRMLVVMPLGYTQLSWRIAAGGDATRAAELAYYYSCWRRLLSSAVSVSLAVLVRYTLLNWRILVVMHMAHEAQVACSWCARCSSSVDYRRVPSNIRLSRWLSWFQGVRIPSCTRTTNTLSCRQKRTRRVRGYTLAQLTGSLSGSCEPFMCVCITCR